MTSEYRPALSVIIPTFQGASRILKPLTCLAKQTFTDFETIVVIDGSTDDTGSKIKSADISLKNVQVVIQQNKGRSGARNSGAKAARGPYYLFLDDDLIFDSDLVEKYYRHVVLRRALVVGSAYPIATSDNRNFFEYASYLNEKWSSGVSEDQTGILAHPYFNAQNCLAERDVFWQLGGFDERLTDAEDRDLGIKAFERNISIFLDSSIVVGHHLQSDFYGYAKRLVSYAKASKTLLAINPNAGKYLAIEGKRIPFSYKLVPADLCVRLMDKNFFRMLPVGIRFRLYDFLLTAYSTVHS
jgi:glycosyltransferase involved in cell wall biosynthesis